MTNNTKNPQTDRATTAPNDENIDRTSSPKTPSDAPLLPHAAASALSTATTVASTVKDAASATLRWTEAKVEKLSAKEEDGTGPYGSMSTCAPSDMDPIGQGVLPALPVEKKESGGRGDEKGGDSDG